MFSAIRRHATYANVVATLALVIAVGGGTAYALQGRNTVLSKHIAPDAVRGKDTAESSLKIPRVVVFQESNKSTFAGETLEAFAQCPEGFTVTGGGYNPLDDTRRVDVISETGNFHTANGWVVRAASEAEGEIIGVYAFCQRGETILE
ncbi:MAG: hypothetical protein M3271_11780 [Actinomycetota bacterium]|nr:hypothetical protein [Actinomycetota bacterium]